MKVELATEALDDLDGILVHILTDHPDAPEIAFRMRDKLQSAIAGLQSFHHYKVGRVLGTRELIIRPYVIPYMVTGKVILVLRVLHGKQRYP